MSGFEIGAAQPERPASPRALALAVAVMCLVWGTTWFAVREGLAYLPPLGSAGLRFAVAWAAMAALAPYLARREGGARPTARLVVAMGVFNFALTYGLVYWGEVYLPSALAAVLWAIYPLLMGVAGHLYLPGERLRGRQWLGLVLGFLGIVLLFVTDLAALDAKLAGRPEPAIGFVGVGLLYLLSPVASVIGTAQVKRHGRGVSSVRLNRDGMLLGACLLLGASWLLERDATWTWSPRACAWLLYLSLAGTVLAFTLYFWALRHTRASRLGMIAYVTPMVAVVVGVAAGGEPVTAWTLLGLATILGGVGLALAGPRARPAARSAPGSE